MVPTHPGAAPEHRGTTRTRRHVPGASGLRGAGAGTCSPAGAL